MPEARWYSEQRLGHQAIKLHRTHEAVIILMLSVNSIIIQTEIYKLLIFQRNREEQDELTASANSLGIDS